MGAYDHLDAYDRREMIVRLGRENAEAREQLRRNIDDTQRDDIPSSAQEFD